MTARPLSSGRITSGCVVALALLGAVAGCAAQDSAPSVTDDQALTSASLDASFGANGFASTTFAPGGLTPGGIVTGSVSAVLPLSDGSVLAVGGSGLFNTSELVTLAVTKFDAHGALVPSFGSGGTFRSTIGNVRPNASKPPKYADFRYPSIMAAKLDAMGRIVVLRGDRSLVRLLSNGTPDTSFGVQGVLDFPIPNVVDNDRAPARGLVVEPNGDIVVGYTIGEPIGSALYLAGGPTTLALTRLNDNGTLDTSFGNGGHSYVSLTQSYADSHISMGSLLEQPDGRFVVTAYNEWGSAQGRSGAILARFEHNGGLDGSFGTAGIARFAGGVPVTAALDADGKLLVAGAIGASDVAGLLSHDPHVAVSRGFVRRFNPDGSTDGSFGNDGSVDITFGASQQSDVRAIHVEANGTIVVGGSLIPQVITRTDDARLSPAPAARDAWQFAIARLTPTGASSPTFGTGGISVAPPRQYVGERAFAMDFDSSGRALLGGYLTAVEEFQWGAGGTGLSWAPVVAVARFN